MQIVKQALYENLFLLNEADVDCLIDYKMKDFDPAESICYSSFLNMICQTTSIEDLLQLQICGIGRLFEKKDMISLYLNPKIIYHRDNLLHYIGRIISNKINGKNKITGKEIISNPNILKYGEVLLLINNKINFLGYHNFEREIIKSFPYHVPKSFFWFYKHRIIRYSYIYEQVIPNMEKNKKALLESGIKLIEKKYSVKFNDYVATIKALFIWFLGAKETRLNSPQFDMKNIRTFYIDKSKFEDTGVIPTLDALSKDIEGFYEEFNRPRRDNIDNDVYRYLQGIFDYPVFKCSDTEFCIIDFKFLIEGICSGLMWKIDSVLKNNNKGNQSIQNIRGQYGYLLENYFVFLMKKIFPGVQLTNNQNSKPDAVLEIDANGENYNIIFEFTAKFYRISSLYNKSSKNFSDDLDRVLFSKERADKGKFINLNKYTTNYQKQNKTVIPILVTESWLGDYDLLNRIDNFLDKKIQEHNLGNLLTSKPFILSLDDLETFWAISSEGNSGKEFVEFLKIWQKAQKGKYRYNFASFVSEGKRLNNREYLDFFKTSNLAKS